MSGVTIGLLIAWAVCGFMTLACSIGGFVSACREGELVTALGVVTLISLVAMWGLCVIIMASAT